MTLSVGIVGLPNVGKSTLFNALTASAAAESTNYPFCTIDLLECGDNHGDVRDPRQVHAAVDGCGGVIHLAAVSRVATAQRDPGLCEATNVGGLSNVLQAAASSSRQPWVVFASSREVYGQPEQLPVREDSPLQPMNVYRVRRRARHH